MQLQTYVINKLPNSKDVVVFAYDASFGREIGFLGNDGSSS